MNRAITPIVVAPVVVVAILVASSGCLFGPIEGIPCEDDLECPSSYFCDLAAQECGPVNDTSGPPQLALTGTRANDGTVTDQLLVPLAELATLTFVIENKGKGPAVDPRLEFGAVSCTTYTFEPLPDEIAGGSTLDVPIEVFAQIGCGNPVTIDWFLFYSGRGSRGTLALHLDTTPGSVD